MKNKLILFVYILGSLISSTGHIQAQCSTCNFEITTGSGTLELSPNEVTCITENLEFNDIKLANNATLCIAPGKTLTIRNNMDNNKAEYLTLELYGKLAMGNPEFNPNNLIMNIHSGGSFEAGNTAFKGNNVIINNQGCFNVSGLNLNGNNSGTINIFNSESATFKTENNLNVENNIALFFNNEGRLEISGHFGLSAISKFSNCGEIETAGFNLERGTIYNTGIFISDEIDGDGEIHNYGTIELNAITGGYKKIYNYGTIVTNSIVDMEIHGPTEDPYYGEFRWKGPAGGVNNIKVFGNQLFKNTDGDSSKSGMLQNSTALKPQTGSRIIWGDCSDCIVVNEGVECIDAETGEAQKKNYWLGGKVGAPNEWDDEENWTANRVPGEGEDIEFATEENNPTKEGDPMSGPAKDDLYVPENSTKKIKNLINETIKNTVTGEESEVKSLVIPPNSGLIIYGNTVGSETDADKIIVKADKEKSTGTLIFTDPDNNKNVQATVEFYNKAYECADCGYFRKGWQYFGIPVASAEFPYIPNEQTLLETIHKWDEPTNGNKWITPTGDLEAFVGYEINNKSTTQPEHIYEFKGKLNVGDAEVELTKSSNVNYSGMNLIGNSFTAAIPISADAIKYDHWKKTVYLFNTGTRDQWRKLNGGVSSGIAAGQYQAVPFDLAGQAGIPDRILSMHTFMLNVETPGNITLKYDKLLKNELNASTVKPWKSAELRSSTIQLPHIVMDVISNGSADRVWLFEKADATTEFDNGWDGYKMKEGDLIQTYVLGSDQSDYQIATVPEIIGTMIGVSSGLNENYSINFSVTPDVESRNLFLRDLFTGRNYSIKNNAEYVINGTNNSNNNRFKIVASSSSLIDEDIMSSPINIYVMNNIIIVDNQSEEDCSVMVYNLIGRLVANKQAPKSQITEFTNINQNKTGVYIVKVLGESNSINKTDRVLLR